MCSFWMAFCGSSICTCFIFFLLHFSDSFTHSTHTHTLDTSRSSFLLLERFNVHCICHHFWCVYCSFVILFGGWILLWKGICDTVGEYRDLQCFVLRSRSRSLRCRVLALLFLKSFREFQRLTWFRVYRIESWIQTCIFKSCRYRFLCILIDLVRSDAISSSQGGTISICHLSLYMFVSLVREYVFLNLMCFTLSLFLSVLLTHSLTHTHTHTRLYTDTACNQYQNLCPGSR